MSAKIYRGPIQAVIFDWGGTVTDHGCEGAVQAMRSAMQESGVHPTEGDLRRRMGVAKLEQLRGLFESEAVREAWVARHGRAAEERDLSYLHERYIAFELQTSSRDLLPGVLPLHEFLRQLGVRVATTTSQPRPVLEQMIDFGRRQGFTPEASACPDDTGIGRPAPYMCYQVATRMRLHPLGACIKVGDTVADVEEGRSAGMWTIGVAETGNEMGTGLASLSQLPETERKLRAANARTRLKAAGAHFVVNTLPDCLPVFERIQQQLLRGTLAN
ncbi:MAG: phosphonoacetaldehyde hydrolase [Bryobacteraceae bacterium]|nr:phosphonoacetaldehyde hydrolase [Bryobacteraceae bacterium]